MCTEKIEILLSAPTSQTAAQEKTFVIEMKDQF